MEIPILVLDSMYFVIIVIDPSLNRFIINLMELMPRLRSFFKPHLYFIQDHKTIFDNNKADIQQDILNRNVNIKRCLLFLQTASSNKILTIMDNKKSIPSFFINGIIETKAKPAKMSSELSDVIPLPKNNREIHA